MNRRGFTLIEMLLVLSILVVAAAFAVPTYDGMITSRRIFHAVDKLQLELQKTRVEAIRTGQAQIFRCHLGTSEYVVQPWLKASDEVEASVGATVVTQLGQALETEAVGNMVGSSMPDPTEGQKLLEEGIVFADAQMQNDTRLMSEQTMTDTMVAAATGWSQPILFYPDGSASTAHLVIQNPQGRRFAIQIRGLIGEAKVVEMPSVVGG
jgi:prepilin-type N-terminal cleavage/methylation domain-containing protein